MSDVNRDAQVFLASMLNTEINNPAHPLLGVAPKTQDVDAIQKFIQERVPALLEAGKNLQPISIGKVISFITLVSQTVGEGLSTINGTDCLEVVKSVIRYVVSTYVRGHNWLLDLVLNDGVINGLIEFIYQTAVKRGL